MSDSNLPGELVEEDFEKIIEKNCEDFSKKEVSKIVYEKLLKNSIKDINNE